VLLSQITTSKNMTVSIQLDIDLKYDSTLQHKQKGYPVYAGTADGSLFIGGSNIHRDRNFASLLPCNSSVVIQPSVRHIVLGPADGALRVINSSAVSPQGTEGCLLLQKAVEGSIAAAEGGIASGGGRGDGGRAASATASSSTASEYTIVHEPMSSVCLAAGAMAKWHLVDSIAARAPAATAATAHTHSHTRRNRTGIMDPGQLPREQGQLLVSAANTTLCASYVNGTPTDFGSRALRVAPCAEAARWRVSTGHTAVLCAHYTHYNHYVHYTGHTSVLYAHYTLYSLCTLHRRRWYRYPGSRVYRPVLPAWI
jgi:hypothetical protein